MLATFLALSIFQPKIESQVLNLNHGWQFAVVPQAPNSWKTPDLVSTTGWKIVSASSEETAQEQSPASNAFDADPKTIWHTRWSADPASFPHRLTIDLGSKTEAIGVRILPRQTSPQNGRPRHVNIYLSDLSNSPTPVLSGEVANQLAATDLRFDATKGRYLTLEFIDGWRNEPFLALSEIGLLKNLDPAAKRAWESQYNIANVAVGDARYDLKGDVLERQKASELKSLKGWLATTLPSAVWTRPLNTTKNWQGVAYYRRNLDVPTTKLRQHAEIRFEGAMQVSDLWLNGQHVGGRRGGYLPLIADLSGRLKAHNEVLVRVDNTDNPLVPPGKPQADLDFNYGNGLYRNASISFHPSVYITDPLLVDSKNGGIRVTFPTVSTDKSILRVDCQVHNESAINQPAKVSQVLRDISGKTVAHVSSLTQVAPGQDKSMVQNLTLKNPHLWSPASPYLYSLSTTVTSADGSIDRNETTVGIRKIEFSRAKGCVINGKPVRLFGTNRHQDYPWVGVAVSDQAQWRDAELIKAAGHNIVRLSHYPQSPTFMDACDHLGILTIPCIPGWQFVNQDPRFWTGVEQDIRDLIRRDRNHPSVAWWETSLNETYPGAKVANHLREIAKSEGLGDEIMTAGDAQPGTLWDIAYNTWKDEDFSRPQDVQPQSPGYIREYGDYEFGGGNSTSRVTFAASEAERLQEAWNEVWSLNHLWNQYPWTMGYGTWEMFDHNVPHGVSASGLADLFRRPKPSYYFFQSQYATKPMVKIAGAWQPSSTPRNIIVFSNADRVSLRVNGREIASAVPERGAATSYQAAKAFDGSNTGNLPHPPFVFRNVSFTTGTLQAVSLRNGKTVAVDQIATATRPAKLLIEVATNVIPLIGDGSDMIFLRARALDAKGNPVRLIAGIVTFTVGAGLQILGDATVSFESGVATTLVRASKPGSFKVMATSDGLSGKANVVALAPSR